MKLRHARVAKAAISGSTIREIAEAEKVSERQIYRILRRTEIRGMIDAAAREIVRSAEVILKRGSEGAARALIGMADGTVRASVPRVAAARAVIEHSSGRALQRTELSGPGGGPIPHAMQAMTVAEARAEMAAIEAEAASAAATEAATAGAPGDADE